MRKTYVIAAGLALVAIIVLFGGAYGFWKYKNDRKHLATAAVRPADNGTLRLSTENADSGSTPLSAQQQNAANTEASNNQGESLQTNLGQQSDTSGSSSNVLDPSTFTKYDQYKNETAARYMVLNKGTGSVAANGKKAVVVYKGWLTNGTLFDASKKDSKTGKYVPFAFNISDGSTPSSVIAGWQEGIAGMKVGEERLLIIPPAVGYGSTAHPPIPANSVLIFDVYLADVQ